MQYSSLTVFLVAFGVVAPVLAAPLENAHHLGFARAHGLKAKHLAARDNSTNSTHDCVGGGSLLNLTAIVENLFNNVTINVLSQNGNGNSSPK